MAGSAEDIEPVTSNGSASVVSNEVASLQFYNGGASTADNRSVSCNGAVNNKRFSVETGEFGNRLEHPIRVVAADVFHFGPVSTSAATLQPNVGKKRGAIVSRWQASRIGCDPTISGT